eukprot:7377633-Prymnesium_polylepis.1
MFNLVRCNCRATMKVINGLRVFANRCFPGTTVMQSAHNEVRDDMRTVFVRVGSKPAEPELLTRPEHAAAFLAGQEAAKAAREEEIKEAAKAADRELRRKQLSDAAKARWRAKKAQQEGFYGEDEENEREEEDVDEEGADEEDVEVEVDLSEDEEAGEAMDEEAGEAMDVDNVGGVAGAGGEGGSGGAHG